MWLLNVYAEKLMEEALEENRGIVIGDESIRMINIHMPIKYEGVVTELEEEL